MGFIENTIAKTRALFQKEIRLFNNDSNITPLDNLPLLYSWFWTAELGLPRNINIVELRQYAKDPVVQMITNSIIKQTIQTPWECVLSDEEDETDYTKDVGKLKTFLNQPNRNGDNFNTLWGSFLRDVLELDAGVVFKGRNPSGELVELFAYDGGRFLINMNQHGIIGETQKGESAPGYFQYSFRYPHSMPLPFEKDEIIYGQVNRLTESFPYGFAPLQSIQQTVEVLIQSTRYNKEFFKNNAIPDALISVPMNDEQMKAFKTQWEQETKGKPHKLIFHNNPDTKVDFLSKSNKDMEWLEGQRWYLHICFAAYGISPMEVGFFESSNRATGESQERTTTKNAIKPYLELIEEKINREIVPELLGHDKIMFKWFPDDQASDKIEHDQTMQKLAANVLTINEVRAKEGLDPVEWGDKPMGLTMQEMTSEDRAKDMDRDKKKEERDKEREKKRDKSHILKRKKPVEEDPIDEDDESVKGYSRFLRKQFNHWEKQLFINIDFVLGNDVSKKKDIYVGKLSNSYFKKSFGEFLRKLFNIVNTVNFREGLAKVIRATLKEGVDNAEEELQIDIGVSPGFDVEVDTLVERQLEGFSIDGKRWSGIKGVAEDLQNKISQIVFDGITEKKGLEHVKSKIKEEMSKLAGGEVKGKVTEGRAMKIARTESNRMINSAKLKAYQDSGLQGKKRWDAFIDKHTSDICRDLDGQIVGLDQPFTSSDGKQFMHPPALPHCRSILAFVLDD